MALARLNSLFEEDMYMQDIIEDLDGITDNSDEMIIGVIEDRYKDDKDHLFDEKSKEEIEEAKVAKDLLDDEDKVDYDAFDVDINELLDDDDF